MKTKRFLFAAILAITATFTAHADRKPAHVESVRSDNTRPIDLVICLDTSHSMDGLIDSAKRKIWDIVNELARAKPTPHVRVALYSYGTPHYGSETGFVRKEIDLTDDLDSVYAKLTALTTNGGDEYVARVLRAATNEQPWSEDKHALKIIVVAGNEPATQDPKFKTTDVCKDAITRGIIVNSIYCGSADSHAVGGWREVAQLTDGQFAVIDQSKGTIVVNTPFDRKLAELSGALNQTYLAFGREAQQAQQQQMQQDANAMKESEATAASRAAAKASSAYRNGRWDLVDAAREKHFNIGNIKAEELPAEMRAMTLEQQKAHIEATSNRRAEIQKEIADLNVKRQQHIEQETRKNGDSAEKAFDAALLRALRDQAQKRGFTFESGK